MRDSSTIRLRAIEKSDFLPSFVRPGLACRGSFDPSGLRARHGNCLPLASRANLPKNHSCRPVHSSSQIRRTDHVEHSVVCCDVNGSGAARCCRCDDSTPIVKELQFFVGEWTSEGSVQDTPIQGALTLKWSPGQYCLVGDHRVQLGGEEIRGSAVWGWDSATRNCSGPPSTRTMSSRSIGRRSRRQECIEASFQAPPWDSRTLDRR